MANQIAIFDFDETLVLENSLGLMFRNIASRNYWLAAVPIIFRSIISGQFGYRLRLNVKRALYKRYLSGLSQDEVYQAGLESAALLTVNTAAMEKLETANRRGDVVVIATASPRIYVSAILDKLNVRRLMVVGTEVDFDSGRIIGAECSREAKWDAVSREISSMNVDKLLAYGNAPDDVFMLKQVDEGFLVKGPKIKKY